MANSNMGWLFSKEYFTDLDYRNLKSKSNSERLKARVDALVRMEPEYFETEVPGSSRFTATTAYPGMLLGSGNAHELPSVEGQAILGFYFDYTTGLPVIAGSTLKGVLRSAFAYPDYIRTLLSDSWDDEQIKALEREIFGNAVSESEVAQGQDIFYDAPIVSADTGGRILSDDFITPHKDPLKDPIPLRFIKVRPGVMFRFSFDLSDGLLGKHAKVKLFMAILEDLGVGAKTNVGYGKLTDFKRELTEAEETEMRKEREKEAFDEAVRSGDTEQLQRFKIDFPESEFVEQIDEAVAQMKEQEEKASIERAFNGLNGEKRKIESFINKYKEHPLAKEFIEKLQEKETPDGDPMEVLLGADNITAVKKQLENLQSNGLLPLSDDVLSTLTSNLKQMYEESSKKNKKKFFANVQLGRFLGEKTEEEIKKAIL